MPGCCIRLSCLVFCILIVSPSFAQEETKSPNPTFGGPDAVENQINQDSENWDDWKSNLSEKYGLSFTLDYSAVGLTATETIPGTDKGAASGMFRFMGALNLVNDGAGALIVKIEHRHSYMDTAPKGLSMGSVGYVGLFEPPFSDQGTRVTNFYYRHRLSNLGTTVVVGLLDPTDYVDPYALASPWLHFMNFAFSTGSATINVPNDAALGIGVGSMLSDNIYVIAGISDINSDPTKPLETFETFFQDNEYFKSVELGLTASKERIIFDNAHVTFWHRDKQELAMTNDGWGIVFSLSRYISDQFMPFLRGGYADKGGSLLQKSVSAGIGYQTPSVPGLLGVAINWGQPNEDTFGPNLKNQVAGEAFYRLDLIKRFAITLDAQLISNPALNPNQDLLFVLGIRTRFAL